MSDLVIVNNFIDGEFVPCDDYLDSYDPSTGQVWARVASSSAKDVGRAVEAAQAAFPGLVQPLSESYT